MAPCPSSVWLIANAPASFVLPVHRPEPAIIPTSESAQTGAEYVGIDRRSPHDKPDEPCHNKKEKGYGRSRKDRGRKQVRPEMVRPFAGQRRRDQHKRDHRDRRRPPTASTADTMTSVIKTASIESPWGRFSTKGVEKKKEQQHHQQFDRGVSKASPI